MKRAQIVKAASSLLCLLVLVGYSGSPQQEAVRQAATGKEVPAALGKRRVRAPAYNPIVQAKRREKVLMEFLEWNRTKNAGSPTFFFAAWGPSLHQSVFPDYNSIDEEGISFFELAIEHATARDVLQYGFYSGSVLINSWWKFPGKIVLRNGERGDTFMHYGRQVRNGAFVTGYPPRTQDMGRNSLAAQPNILYLGALANCTSANGTWPTSGCCVEPLAEKCGQDGPAEMQLHPGLLHAGAELAYRETHFPKHKRQKFLVYANSNCVPYREDAFDKLVELAENLRFDSPVAIGRCHGSHPSKQLREALPFGSQGRPNKNGNTSSANEQLRANNKALMQGYHFALVMENSLGESYVTEKIATAFISGAIPIYYGTEHVFDIFNREAFIFWNPQNPSDALQKIARLMKSRTEMETMQTRPVLAHGSRTLENYFSIDSDVAGGKLATRIRTIVDRMPSGQSAGVKG